MNTRFRRFAWQTAPLILLPFLFGACGEKAAPETAQADPEAANAPDVAGECSFFSQADAEAALGAPVKEPKRTGYGSVEECTFETVEEKTNPKVLVIRVEGTRNPDATYEQMRELLSGDEITIGGHRALLPATSQVLVVTDQHQVLLSLGAPGMPSAQRRENLIKIAETVVSRL